MLASLCTGRFLWPWLTAFAVSGHPDGLQLAEAAQAHGVPVHVLWAVAYAETRHSLKNTEISTAGALGRLQVMPRYWGHQCGALYGRRHYTNNIHCGAAILRFYYDASGSWDDAIYLYYGKGLVGRRYQRDVQRKIGEFVWREVSGPGPP